MWFTLVSLFLRHPRRAAGQVELTSSDGWRQLLHVGGSSVVDRPCQRQVGDRLPVRHGGHEVRAVGESGDRRSRAAR